MKRREFVRNAPLQNADFLLASRRRGGWRRREWAASNLVLPCSHSPTVGADRAVLPANRLRFVALAAEAARPGPLELATVEAAAIKGSCPRAASWIPLAYLRVPVACAA